MSLSAALAAIDAAHSLDPRVHEGVPYELHYAKKCTKYLHILSSNPSEALQIAVRAQHLRRWEVPRSNYPMTKPGYYQWRTGLKARQASQAREIAHSAGYDTETCDKVSTLIKKENIKSDFEAQTLEDVACLVFLDDQFEDFKGDHSEDKIIAILRKTWPKMSEAGQREAMKIDMSDDAKRIIGIALR